MDKNCALFTPLRWSVNWLKLELWAKEDTKLAALSTGSHYFPYRAGHYADSGK
jgi:hypothetical protein